MDSTAILFIIIGVILVGGLFAIGIYLVARRDPKPQEPTGYTPPLPYSQPQPTAYSQPSTPGQPQPQVIYVREQPKPRGLLSRPIDWIALAAIIIIAAGLIIPRLVGGYTPTEMGAHKITFQIRGTAASASITLSNAQGGTEQHEISLPSHVTYTMDAMSPISLLAQKKGEAGTIICEVYDGDALWLTSTSSAPYGICMVNGMVGYK